MNRLSRFLPTFLGFCLGFLPISAIAKDRWVSVRTKNFFLVGNTSEGDVRQVATKFEQFKDVVSRLFPKIKTNSDLPVTIIVFKSDSSYRPFKPLYQGKPTSIAGYFQQGQDVNYITLTSEHRETSPYAAIFHEYIHLLIRNDTRHTPLWCQEGLAEYYSTFEVTEGDKKVWLGKVIPGHVYLLRENKLLPLSVLFSVEHESPHYNEREKQGIFYAQSWALVHYFVIGNNLKRTPQFIRYLNLVASGLATEESFRQAFQVDYSTLEKELNAYIRQDRYMAQPLRFDEKLQFDSGMQVASVREAEALSYLGDLLFHTQRLEEAETYLKQALVLDPNLVPAHASFGALCFRQKRWAEARQHLERAAAGDSRNFMAHFSYAQLLSRSEENKDLLSSSFSAEIAQTLRAELKKTIELAPGFPDSYRLLAYVNVVTGEDLDGTILLLKRAQSVSPGREELAFDLGQLYLRKEDFAMARKILEPIARNSSQQELKNQSEILLDRIKAQEEDRALFKGARQQMNEEREETQEGISEETASSEAPTLRRRPKSDLKAPGPLTTRDRYQGEKVAGLLTRVDCAEKKVVFHVRSGARTLKFYSHDPERILLFGENKENKGTITMACGPRTPASPVIVTFRRPADASSGFDGDLLTVIFGDEK